MLIRSFSKFSVISWLQDLTGEGGKPGPIYQYENGLINEILHVKSTQYDNMMLVR
jgi:hypothetical protein